MNDTSAPALVSPMLAPSLPPEQKIHVAAASAAYDLAAAVRCLTIDAVNAKRTIIVLCIGTDRSTGDALGPLTGEKLRLLAGWIPVYGTLDEPVHAANLSEHISLIKTQFRNPFILAVDACLGRLENVGCLSVGPGPVRPGTAVKKDLAPVGDAYITGVVNVGGFLEHLVLQSTRLSLVMKMADTIAGGLYRALAEIAPPIH